MLQRYLDINGCPVPCTEGRYFHLRGLGIFDSVKKGMCEAFVKNDAEYITIDFGDSCVDLKLNVVIALATKNPRIPRDKWQLLDIMHVDGDLRNYHPGNLVWKFPEGGLESHLKGFYYVPGYSYYLVNREGEVYSTAVKRLISPYVDGSGYFMYGVQPDIGDRTICGQHRLLALAFLPYPANVDILDVNHIDGIKQNNAIVNLEWASRKRNCDHAYSSGLRTDNVPVLVKNIFSGEVKEFYSFEEAARRMKVDGETIRFRAASEGSRIFPVGILVKRKDCANDWKTIKDPLTELLNSKLPLPIIVENMETGEQTTYPAATSIASVVNVKPGLVSYYFSDKTRVKQWGKHKVYYPDFEKYSLSAFAEM